MNILNEITVDGRGNATVYGSVAHLLWDYCRGCFPRTKCCSNNFYVMEYREFPQGYRWDFVTGETTREEATRFMNDQRVLIDVTNAPSKP